MNRNAPLAWYWYKTLKPWLTTVDTLDPIINAIMDIKSRILSECIVIQHCPVLWLPPVELNSIIFEHYLPGEIEKYRLVLIDYKKQPQTDDVFFYLRIYRFPG